MLGLALSAEWIEHARKLIDDGESWQYLTDAVKRGPGYALSTTCSNIKAVSTRLFIVTVVWYFFPPML